MLPQDELWKNRSRRANLSKVSSGIFHSSGIFKQLFVFRNCLSDVFWTIADLKVSGKPRKNLRQISVKFWEHLGKQLFMAIAIRKQQNAEWCVWNERLLSTNKEWHENKYWLNISTHIYQTFSATITFPTFSHVFYCSASSCNITN